jgi:non-ribosomal peptide synthetase component F
MRSVRGIVWYFLIGGVVVGLVDAWALGAHRAVAGGLTALAANLLTTAAVVEIVLRAAASAKSAAVDDVVARMSKVMKERDRQVAEDAAAVARASFIAGIVHAEQQDLQSAVVPLNGRRG